MRPCPYCGVTIESNPSTGTATLDMAGTSSKKAIEGYSCPACGRKFTVVKSRSESLILSTKEVELMRKRLDKSAAGNESLRKKVGDLTSEARSLKASLKTAKDNAYARTLQSRLSELERHVESLKKEKGRLEEHLARMG
jgi:DNA repair exonuclease SbcCD ATPase subunit